MHVLCLLLLQFSALDADLESIFKRLDAEEAKFTDAPARSDKEWVTRKLQHMVDVDQMARTAYMRSFAGAEERNYFFKRMHARTREIDRANREELKQILKHWRWVTISEFGEKAEGNAWLLVQHADMDPAFQHEVLAVLTELLPKGETRPSSYANLWDRVAHADGKPQRYGTQGRCVSPGKWEPWEMEEPTGLDARRASVGLEPIADYIKRFDKKLCP